MESMRTLPGGLEIRRAQEFVTERWSGGTTTELFIFPEGSSYATRDFSFRLSVATVEVPFSHFTPLPDIERKTLVLEGEVVIHHREKYSKRLRPFDVDIYSGDWDTSSDGMCRDFNVMTSKGIESEVFGSAFPPPAILQLIGEEGVYRFYYFHSGKGVIEGQELNQGDLLILHPNESYSGDLEVMEHSEIIFGMILLPVAE